MTWLFALALAGADLPPAALLKTGTFHGDEVAAKDGTTWMALVPSNGAYTWRRVRVSVKAVLDPITGNLDGKQVSIAGEVPVFLLQRAHPWMSRTVAFEKSARVTLRGNQWTFDDRGTSQVLYEWPTPPMHDEHRAVLWAGDLDGDGRTDLLVDVSEHSNVSRIRLYLSTNRAGSGLVGLAAELVQLGC